MKKTTDGTVSSERLCVVSNSASQLTQPAPYKNRDGYKAVCSERTSGERHVACREGCRVVVEL